VVTIDAMGCQKDIAAKIVGGGGQYVLAVKENQPHLYEDIERAFDEALDQGEPGVDFTECQTEGPRKSRQETRTCCVITNPKGIRDAGLWTGLTAIVMVISERVVNGVAGSETRYFIGSVARTAEEYLRWVRGHWGIENSLHWCTGCWTSVSTRMTKGIGRGTARRIWGGSGSWRCVCSRRRRAIAARERVSTPAAS
jgi:predicted transposase YbfD/YdcC